MQVSPSLIQRISTANESIFQKLTLKPLVTPEFEMTLYQQPLWKAIDSLSLYETTVPVAPVLVSNNCFVDNSRLSVTWLPDPRGVCDGYALELDNGSGFTVCAALLLSDNNNTKLLYVQCIMVYNLQRIMRLHFLYVECIVVCNSLELCAHILCIYNIL